MGTKVTPGEHLAQVQASVDGAADPRLAEIMRAAASTCTPSSRRWA